MFRGFAIETDITIPHEHSRTGMPHAPVPAAQLSESAAANRTICIYTHDRMPCKEMTEVGGKPCQKLVV
jgi:hypothetical protein